jgi:hypothetical protein
MLMATFGLAAYKQLELFWVYLPRNIFFKKVILIAEGVLNRINEENAKQENDFFECFHSPANLKLIN